MLNVEKCVVMQNELSMPYIFFLVSDQFLPSQLWWLVKVHCVCWHLGTAGSKAKVLLATHLRDYDLHV